MTPDLVRMERAMRDAMQALAPVVTEHGATLALPAIASAMGLLLVGCHRMGATGCPLAEATGLLSRRFGDAVGEALRVSVEMQGRPEGRA